MIVGIGLQGHKRIKMFTMPIMFIDENVRGVILPHEDVLVVTIDTIRKRRIKYWSIQ